MGKQYSYRQRVNTYNCLLGKELSPLSLLEWFQEAAQLQCQELGIGLDFMTEKGLGWFIVSYDIELFDTIQYGEELEIRTESIGYRGFEALRDFWLMKGEKCLAKASSKWMVMNHQTGRIVRPESIEELLRLSDEAAPRVRTKRFDPIESISQSEVFPVRIRDIDSNQHVNHVHYLEWALELIPIECLEKERIRRIQMVFKDQAFYAQDVRCEMQIIENGYRMDLYESDRLLTQIEIQMKKAGD